MLDNSLKRRGNKVGVRAQQKNFFFFPKTLQISEGSSAKTKSGQTEKQKRLPVLDIYM